MKEKAPGIGVINLLQLHYVKEPRLYIIITLTREQEKDSSNSKYNKLKHYHDEKKGIHQTVQTQKTTEFSHQIKIKVQHHF